MRKLKKMVEGLGAREFRERPFFPDPYEVLGVGPGASDEEVAAAHRKLVCVPPLSTHNTPGLGRTRNRHDRHGRHDDRRR